MCQRGDRQDPRAAAHQNPVTLNADIAGAQYLYLVVGDGDDGGDDHGDWGIPRLTCDN